MRFIIGIDLGTTNCNVFYVDTTHTKPIIHPFNLLQLTAEGTVQQRNSLPSFCYIDDDNAAAPAFKLPWQKSSTHWCVGTLALQMGAKTPTRLVSSAKSWLCQPNAGGKDKMLPFEAASTDIRISPLEASIRYLAHIRDAWNYMQAKGSIDNEFEQQEIIITVPASFDEVARALTAEAATTVGIKNFSLLEEPQAAFYSWIASHADTWQNDLPHNASILVCDIGGGTTDFSLINVIAENDSKKFSRSAVGEHLLLGGDNLDNAIAHMAEPLFATELNSMQWLQLCHQARFAKEKIMHDNEPNGNHRISLQGSGSNVIGGSLSATIDSAAFRQKILEGFFPLLDFDKAKQINKPKGLRSTGLAYEEEPAITKHLAAFLAHAAQGEQQAPDFVLFNGGTMQPKLFRDAILKSLKHWFPEKSPIELQTHSLDLAVARGAAYFGMVKRGLGIRIAGGSARSYYMAINVADAEGKSQEKALTLLPKGSLDGASYAVEHSLTAIANAPVAFHLLTSHVRFNDQSGDIVDINPDEMHRLCPLQTILLVGKNTGAQKEHKPIPVQLLINLTDIGTLDIWLNALQSNHRWQLQFQVRSAAGQENYGSSNDTSTYDVTYAAGQLVDAEQLITQAFQAIDTQHSNKLMEQLESVLAKNRREWPTGILRGLWNSLLAAAPNKKRTNEHEKRWWNLAGFLLRPGYGAPLDDYRIKDLWRIMLAENKSTTSLEVALQQLICLRRVASGLTKGQQTQIANAILPDLINKKNGQLISPTPKEQYAYDERLRTLAAFEAIELNFKIKLGKLIIEKLKKAPLNSAELWALSRIGSRHLFHASAAYIVPKDICTTWVETLLQHQLNFDEPLAFCLSMLAKLTPQREINLPIELRNHIIAAADATPYAASVNAFLTDPNHSLSIKQQSQVFGEPLPAGLSLIETSSL